MIALAIFIAIRRVFCLGVKRLALVTGRAVFDSFEAGGSGSNRGGASGAGETFSDSFGGTAIACPTDVITGGISILSFETSIFIAILVRSSGCLPYPKLPPSSVCEALTRDRKRPIR